MDTIQGVVSGFEEEGLGEDGGRRILRSWTGRYVSCHPLCWTSVSRDCFHESGYIALKWKKLHMLGRARDRALRRFTSDPHPSYATPNLRQ